LIADDILAGAVGSARRLEKKYGKDNWDLIRNLSGA